MRCHPDCEICAAPAIETVVDEPRTVGGLMLTALMAALVIASLLIGAAIGSARADEAPVCIPAALRIALVREPGVSIVRVGHDGQNPAAIVVAYLANIGAPDLEADDFLLSTAADGKLVVTPVRAGLWCRSSKSLLLSSEVAAGLKHALEMADRDRI